MQHSSRASDRYGLNPWRITETGFHADDYGLNATLFALGNGYVGLRGTFDEGFAAGAAESGCYLNGVYYSEPITYGEQAYGYAKNNQRIASAALPHELGLTLDGVAVDFSEGELLEHQRELELDNGLVSRQWRWRAPSGQILRLASRRLVSLTERQLVVMEYRLSLESGTGELGVTSSLDATPAASADSDDPRVGAGVNIEDLEPRIQTAQDGRLTLSHHLKSSGFTLSSAAGHRLEGASVSAPTHDTDDFRATCRYQVTLTPEAPLVLTKYVVYGHGGDEAPDLNDLLARCEQRSFDDYARDQRAAMDAFWASSDIEVGGDPALQQGLRFNLFHLFQSLGRDPGTNIAAKGLTGHGYDGHYFWDSEIYILPFFLYTQPQLARNLLLYRHSILDAARARARELAIPKGALFPWRTIGGEECSAYYPAGTAQFHINADVAYAVKQYHEATGDDDFLIEAGAEVVLESARLWPAIGHYNAHRGDQFCINEVTGPDEYTALVNNNFFTNAMAQAHLRYAVELYQWLKDQAPAKAKELYRAMALDEREVADWAQAAERMYLPYDESQGIHLQDDSFLDKPRWDFEHTPADHYPLLLHYHPLTIYRHQVCKQADTVLALFLLSDQFSREQKKRDFDFYEPITTHDSTLSACMHSILANEVGYPDKSRHYFEQVARMDLDNHHRNTQHGIHTACMGGTWLCLVQGFGGMRLQHHQLMFNPTLPKGLSHYRFKVRVQGRLIEVSVDASQAHYQLLEGAPITLQHGEHTIALEQDQAPVAAPLRSPTR